MKKLGAALVSGLVACAVSWGAWTISPVYNCGNTAYRLSVSAARGDGQQRLYCAAGCGVYELSWEHGAWVNRTVGSVPGIAYDITSTAGRADGVVRIYVASGDGHMYEFSYASNAWSRTDMGGDDNADMDQVAFGTGRNDHYIRCYGTMDNGHIFEFTWADCGWRHEDLGRIADQMVDLVVGSTGHDTRTHIYASSQAGGIYEVTYQHGAWTSTMIDQLVNNGAPWGMAMGCITDELPYHVEGSTQPTGPDFCGDQMLFVTTEAERDVWSYHWVSGVWHKASIGAVGGTQYPIGADVAVGPGRNDGVRRVYQVNKNSHVYEFSLSGGHWHTLDLGSGGSGWSTGITVGTGRGDGVQRVYSCYPSGEVAEFTFGREADGPTSVPDAGAETQVLRACPNPFAGATSILLAARSPSVTRIEVCDASGRLVRHLAVPGSAGLAVWDGRDDAGHALVKGVYLAKVEQAGVTSSARLLKLQ